jgi:hypothetical protein
VRSAVAGDDGQWIKAAPSTTEQLAAIWSIRVGPPLVHDGDESLVFPVIRNDGSTAILKLSNPGIGVTREA